MAQPDPYTRLTRFTGTEAGKATATLGVNLDKEFDEARLTIEQIRTNLGLIQRDDTALANKTVHPEALDDVVLAMLSGASLRLNGSWAVAKTLTIGDIVESSGALYVALVDHTAVDFAADLAAKKIIGPIFDPAGYSNLLALLASTQGASLIGTASGGTVEDMSKSMENYVNPALFRQLGDGNDYALAVQRAIDAVSLAGGGTVHTSGGGPYTLLSAVNMASNVTWLVDPSVTIYCDGAPSPCVTFYGTVGPEVSFGADATNGDTALSFIASHGFAAGDLIHLVSQRNALSRTDAGGWWLGDGTASLPYAYFSEFHYVQAAPSSSTVTLADAIIFASYKTTAAGETETLRTTSAAKKVTPCVNARVLGGKFSRAVSGSSIFETNWAVRCIISPDVIERGRLAGKSISIQNSLQCVGGGSERMMFHVNDPSLAWSYASMHGTMNRFFVIGSQDCGFERVWDSYSGQSVDFSYSSSAQHVNIRPFCKNSWFLNCYEGLTSHPGSYQENWNGNVIAGCGDDAVTIRGYMPTITDNRLYGNVDTTDGSVASPTYGIVLAYGGPRRAVVRGNTIRGFYGAVDIRDSNTLEWQWGNVLADISSNSISHCFVGLNTSFSTTYKSSSKRYITYANNSHSYMGRFLADLSQYSAGVTFRNNTMDGSFRYTGGGAFVALFNATSNCPDIAVERNTWRRPKGGNAGYTIYGTAVGSVTDTTTYPKADWAGLSYSMGNEIDFQDADGVISSSFGSSSYIQTKYADNGATYTIASGVIEVVENQNRVIMLRADTEGAAASDDLDRIMPYANTGFRAGDVIYLRTSDSARDIVLRDVTTSGAASYGIQTPANASVTLNTINDVAHLLFSGTHWLLVSSTSNL